MSVFIATAKGGKLDWGSLSNEARLSQFLQDNEGKKFKVEKLQTKRSLSQNNLLWAYYRVISQETGHSENEIHEWAKRMFLPPKHIEVMGRSLKIPASTTDLTKSDFVEYMMRISAETNVPIPDPEDYYKPIG